MPDMKRERDQLPATPESEPEIVLMAREFVALYEHERATIKSRILRPVRTDELDFARGVIEFYEKSERAIDETLEKILNASDDQISATLRTEGHDPQDVATIARQCAEIAILKHDRATRSESAPIVRKERADLPELIAYWRTKDRGSDQYAAADIIERLLRDLEVAEGLERMAYDQRDKALEGK